MTRKQLLQYSLLITIPILAVFVIDRSWQTSIVLVSVLGLNTLVLELFRREDVSISEMRKEVDKLRTQVDGMVAMMSMRSAL